MTHGDSGIPLFAIILWTVTVLCWARPGGVLAGLLTGAVLYECFFLLCTLPESSLPSLIQHWPLLRPSTWPMVGLAMALLVGDLTFRYYRGIRSPKSPSAKPMHTSERAHHEMES